MASHRIHLLHKGIYGTDMCMWQFIAWTAHCHYSDGTKCGYIQQCSAKVLEKWGQMTHPVENYADIGNFSGVSAIILPLIFNF